MSPERWQKIDQLLDQLLDCSPHEQDRLLEAACVGDPALREEVEALLAAQQKVSRFIETPPSAIAEILAPPTPNHPASTLAVGLLLKERYRIESELGRGGVGVVYLARDTQLHARRVVVKVLLDAQAAASSRQWFEKKFEQEIEALARLDHPGVVGVLDAGTTAEGKPFFVMQFVEGVMLRHLMGGAKLAFPRVSRIVRQIAQALSAAHDKGVIHRDLKPENIMVQVNGEAEESVKLIDFGIASLKDSPAAASAEKTKVAGTMSYMSPEQFRGQPEAASDLWALGVIAYELLTGQLPFQADTLIQLYELQQTGVQLLPRQLRPDLPPAAQSAILQALAFDPKARFARARDFGEVLAQALASEETATDSTDAVAPFERTSTATNPASVRTMKWPVLLLVAGLLLATILGVFIWRSSRVAVPSIAVVNPPAVRLLSYSLRTRPNPQKYPQARAESWPGEIIFTPGDELRLNFVSAQEGYFYLLNEGPEPVNGLPRYNVLFPAPNVAAPTLRAQQPLYLPQEQPPWFRVDQEQGTETLWLIWSPRSLPELEAVRQWLNAKDGGEIKDAAAIKLVQEFLRQHFPAAKPSAEKDEQQTHLKGNTDGLLIYPMKLAHR